MSTGSIGERVAVYRRRRGLSQAALAGLIGRSESWLSQVERGVRSVDRLSVVADLSRVLQVDVESLIGRPWQVAPNGGHDVEALDGVRTYFAKYSALTQAETGTIDALDLRSSCVDAHRTYQAAQYVELAERLPALLEAADAAWDTRRDGSLETMLSYVGVYVVAAKLLTKMGVSDLALVSADRAAHGALCADSIAARGMAAYQVVCAMLRADRPDDAETLAVEMAAQMSAAARSDEPGALSVAGSLWLIAAVVAARKTDRFEAHRRLDQAQHLADLLGEDGNHLWTAFGPTNVAIHRVSVAAELGDPGEALSAAAGIRTDSFPVGLQSRRAQMHLDLAWAQSQRKRDAEAVLHLMEAEQVAPEAVYYNVLVREMIREMLARGSKAQTSALDKLAVRAGVLT